METLLFPENFRKNLQVLIIPEVEGVKKAERVVDVESVCDATTEDVKETV